MYTVMENTTPPHTADVTWGKEMEKGENGQKAKTYMQKVCVRSKYWRIAAGEILSFSWGEGGGDSFRTKRYSLNIGQKVCF
jgi:hypothetical protein